MGTVLNTVYNNYLTTYTPKSVSRYDTHKKSELRSVYNSIVKLNKESPWYLPTTNKDTQHYAVDIKENAHTLRNTISQLGVMDDNGLINKKSAYTTNDAVATATYIGDTEADTDFPNLSLEVQALASPQENMGEFLENTRVRLSPATYSFDININDMNYEFQFSIGESETNRDVQERLARLVNNSGIGITATIKEADSRTSLCLESESTGTINGKSQIFNISDTHTSKKSGTVEYFGLNYISKPASDAKFTLNGEERSTSSNRFTIQKAFEVELKGVSAPEEATQIGIKTDIESLSDNISHLLGGYNDFIKTASTYVESQAKSKQLIQEIKGIASLYNSDMESTGISFGEDGTLTVNSNLLQVAAAQSEDISETFGYLKDFSNLLMRKSNQVALNPMNYVEKTVVAYKNPGHNFVSPYFTSAYSGMMFNGYC